MLRAVRPTLRGWTRVVAAVAVVSVLPTIVTAQVRRAYTVRYATNDAGDIVIRGNTLATCTTTLAAGSNAGALTCASAQAGGVALNLGVNNNYVMQYVDVDGNPATFNSSSSSLNIPTGASVLFAGLYWSGRSTNAQRGQVQFRTPATPGYVTLVASTLDANGTSTEYQGFADVTSLVQAGGSGSYTTANVQANIGTNAGNDFAGWSLVVVVRDGSRPLRNLTVFDGFGQVQSGATVNTTVSGFLTPALGTPTTRVGVVSWEGDRGTGFTNDLMKVNGTNLTDALSPSTDFFNSTIADTGIYVTAGQNPAFTNQMGVDMKQVKTNAVPAGATSATISFTTSGDQYFPAVITFLVDLFNPVINGNVVKLVTDLNGGLLSPGDTLQYDMTVKNSGQDGAVSVMLVDTIPTGTTYVPGSLVLVSGANAGNKTDATADDQGEFQSAGPGRVLFRLGTGASGSAGGTLAPGATAAMKFKVRVNDTLPAGTIITNQAIVTAISQTLGTAINAKSRDSLTGGGGTPPTNVAVAGPNLTITKTHPADFPRGGTGAYTLTVSNIGNAGTTSAPIVVIDTVPAPIVPTSASGTGWTCTVLGQVVTCTLTGGLAASSAAAPITLNVAVPTLAPGSFTNIARVSGGGDNTPANNSASDLTVTTALPDLLMSKVATTATFTIGSTAVFNLIAKNIGSAAASDSMRMRDTLPAGLTFASGTGAGFTCVATGQAVSCFRPAGTPVAVGDSVILALTVNVLAAAAPSVVNRARVSTPLDPNVANNVATSAAVPVVSAFDVQMTKAATSAFSVGQNATYGLTVTNVGGSPTTGVITVVDTLSAGLSFVGASGGGFSCVSAPPLVTCTRPAAPALAASATATIALTVAVGLPALPTVSNLARASTPGDQNATNDTARVVSTPVIGVPDLAMTKTASGTLAVGNAGTFTLLVQNLGSAPTTGAITVTDTLAAGLTFNSAAGGGFSCVAAAQVVTCTNPGPIAAGGSSTITLTVTPTAAAIPSVNNTAWVSTPNDGNAANNSGATGAVGVVSVPDMAMRKSSLGAIAVGGTTSYQLTVVNVSPGASTGVITVSDVLPTGLSFVSGVGGGFTCGASGQNVSCTRPAAPALAALDSVQLTLTVGVDSTAAASVVNRAISSTPGDLNPSNDTGSTAPLTVNRADLTIAKSHAPSSWSVGVGGSWTITVSNSGTSATTALVTLVDSLPANVSFTGTTGAGWSCATSGVVATGQVLTCTNAGPIPAGGASTLVVQATPLSGAIGTATNIARVSTPGESSTANNRVTDPTPVGGIPDLAVFKSHSGSFITNLTATYTILVQNVGSAATSSTITVTDTLPTGLTFSSGTGGGFGCSASGQVVTCTSAGPIAASASASISLVVNVLASALPSVTNTVRVSTPGDVNATNDFGSDSPAPVIASPDLAISKAPDSLFVIGRPASWTITVQNVSPGSQPGQIDVTDTLPTGMTYRATGSGGSGFACATTGTFSGRDIVLCSRATAIAANTIVRFPLFVNVAASAFPSQVNKVTVSAPGDANPTNDSFTTGPVSVSSIPDLSLAKAPTGAVIVNDTVTFTMSVTNVSAGPTTAAISVRDSLATGLTYTNTGSGGSGFSCSAAGQIVTCTSAGPIAAGALVQFPLRATVALAAFPTVVNKASVSTTGDFNFGNDTATTPALPVTSVPDFALVKTGSGPINVGSNTAFTLTLSNVSPVSAGLGGNSGLVTITDTLPAGFTFVSGTDPGSTFACSVTGTLSGPTRQIVACVRAAPPTQPAITAGQSVTITLTTSVGAAALGSFSNGATVQTAGDINATNDRGATSTLSVVAPDLTVTKAAIGTFVRSQLASYQLTVSNVGTGATTGTITVVDNLAPGLGYQSVSGAGWSCSATGTILAGQTVTCTSAGPVAAAGSSIFTIAVLVDPAAASSVNNTATVTTPNDTNAGNNATTLVGTPVSGAPDIQMTKAATTAFIVGQPASWKLIMKNVGSIATSDSVRVVDTLPVGTTFTSASGGAYACTAAAGIVSCKRPPPLAAGDSDVVTVTVQVGNAALPSVTNRAWAQTATDPNTSNNGGSATTAVTTAPDLRMIKGGPATLTAGQPFTYHLSVVNGGSAATTGPVTITDTLPTGISYVFASGGGFACGVSGQVVTCTRAAAMLVGDSLTVTLNATVANNATGPIANRAWVANAADPNATNNSGTSPSAPVSIAPDLAITKTSVGAFIVGRSATFRMSVRNVGSGPTTGAITLTDTLPSGLSFASGSPAAWSCGAAAQVVTCTNTGPIVAGDSSVLTLTVNVAAGALPNVSNTASVSTVGDPAPVNDVSATGSIPVTVAPDLIMAKTSLAASYVLGDTAQFRMKVTNGGSGPTTGAITLTDTIATGLSFLSALPSSFTCGVSGQVVTCTRAAALVALDTASVVVRAVIGASAGASTSNRAWAQTPGDPAAVNDSGSTGAIPLTAVPNLRLIKRVLGTLTVGTPGQYQLVAQNVAVSPTTGATTLVDTLPVGLTYASNSGGGWSCVAAAGNVVTCTLPTPIAALDSSRVTITVAVAAAAFPSVTNHAHVNTPGETITTDNAATAGPTAVAGAPDLRMVKTGPFTLIAGQPAAYTLSVVNGGTAATTAAITITDTLPVSLTFVSASGGGFTCTPTGQVVSCTRATAMLVGDSVAVALNTTLSNSATGTLSNRARVATAGDASAPNDSASSPVAPINTAPDLTVSKTAVGSFIVGRTAAYRMAVRNVGSGTTSGPITLVDTLPSGLSFSSASPAAWSCGAAAQIVTCTNAGPIAAGDSSVLTLTVNVAALALPSVVNSATVTTPGDPAVANNASSTPATPVTVAPDVAMTKTALAASYVLGDTAQFRLKVTNGGSGPTTGVITLTDTLATGLSFLNALPSSFTCGVSGQVVTCSRAVALVALDTASVVVRAVIGASAGASTSNRAWAQTPGDPAVANDSSSTGAIPLTAVPNLRLIKRVLGTLTVGTPGQYQFVAQNVAVSPTTGATSLVDTLPAGLTYASNSGGGWSCVAAAGNVVTCTLPTPIAALDSSRVTITVAVGAASFPSVTNRAHVNTPGETITTDNAATAGPTAVAGAPDISMTKTSLAASYIIGDTAQFRLKVTNAGTVGTTGAVTLTDTLGTGLTFLNALPSSFTCGVSGQVVTCTRAAAIVAGDTASVVLRAVIGATAGASTSNRAWAQTPGDPTAANDSASTGAIPLTAVPNLRLVKRVVGSLAVGSPGQFQFVVRNVAASPTTGATTMVDTLPAGLTYLSSTGTGWACVSGAGNVVTCVRATPIPALDSSIVTITMVVSPAAFPSLTNSASVSTPGEVTTTDNGATTGVVSVSGAPDLGMTKTALASSYALGDTAQFRLKVTNVGTAPTTGVVTFTDTLATGLSFLGALPSSFSCGASGQVITCTRPGTPALAALDTASVVLRAAIAASAGAAVSNRAWVQTAGDQTTANDSGNTGAIPLVAVPNLRLAKRVIGTLAVGQPGQFQFAVQNVAVSPTTGPTTLVDTLPNGLAYVSSTGTGWSCVAGANRVVTCTRATPIPGLDSTVVNMTVSVAAAALPAVTNTASVSTPGELSTTDNGASTGAVPVLATPDLSITKAAVGAFTVATPATYTLTVNNLGTGATLDTIRVVDSLPASLAFVSASGPSFACANASGVVTCLRTAPIPSGGSAIVTLVATPSQAAVPSVTNVARVSTPFDASNGNDRATINTPVSGLSNIAIAKTGGDTLNVGAAATYTLTASNVGTLTVPAGFTVVDSLPTGLTFQSATSAGFGCAAVGRAVTCTSTAAIVPGAAVPISLITLVSKAAFPAVTNRVLANLAGDVDTTNNRAAKASVVRGTVDLDVKKTAATAQFTSGIDNNWILRVANRGNVPTQGAVTVVDTLPAGLTFTSGTGPNWTCSAAGQVVTCTAGAPLADADSVLITLKTKASATLAGNITNCITGATALDANPANDRSCATVAVVGDFRLQVQKTSRSQVVEVGGTNDYTVVVRNIGLSAVPAVALNDLLPAGFSYQLGTSRLAGAPFADPAGGAGPALTWQLGLLNPGDERSITYRVKIGPNLRNGTSVNRASASSGTIIVQANSAAAPVLVQRGVFTDRGVIVGKVFASCDCADERMQTNGELGIPGVRVYLEDGTSAITDVEGKYNFWDASSGMHVVKVDATTLPVGARLVVTSNRNALDPNSRFVDLKGGELAKADFATANDAAVLMAVRERRRKGEPEAAMTARRSDSTRAIDWSSKDSIVKAMAEDRPAAAAATSAPATAALPAPVSEQPVSALDQASRWEGSREGEGQAAAAPVLPTAPPLIVPPMLTDATSNLPATPLRAAQQLPGLGTASGRVEIAMTGAAYAADGTSAIPVIVRLFDAKGQKLSGRVPVTLEASLGRWLVGDVDRTEQGAQVVVTDGEGTFKLLVPGTPGRGELRVTSPSAQAALPVTFTPSNRPLVVAGLFNGRIDLSAFSGGSLVTSAPDNLFESRLTNWTFTQDSGKVRGGMRAALFAKGTVFNDQLLTLGFDSERDDSKNQFRDIQPDQMYPTYGDGSLREFDAQTQTRLYARLDRGASFSRFGDFNTQRAGDTRLLGAWDRSLNGLQHHEEGAFGAGNVYLARGTIRQVIDELPGRGISGPYFLSKPNAVINSERVELLTRDRNQPALILQVKPMQRFADYTVEPFTGRLLFRAPVASLDANFNPVTIRVTYELDQGGAAYNTYGADATFKLGSRLEIGGIAALDENPLDSLKLFGANASYRFGERTVGLVEVAQATGMGGQDGRAGRFEFRTSSEGFDARVYGTRAGTGFANRSATFGNGRQELGFRATKAMTESMRLLAEALETEDLRTGGKRDGALVTLEQKFGTMIRAELGVRWAKETGSASAGTLGLLVPPSFSALRAKITSRLPGSERSSLSAEFERDLASAATRASLGAEYVIASRTRAYARHEWVDGYAGPYGLTTSQSQQNTVFGIDADYAKNAQIFSEYRERDAINGRDAEASIGLRNRWALGPGLLFNTSLERVAPLSGAGQGNATAVTGAIEYTRPATTKSSLRAEWRRSNGMDGYLFSAGLAQKLARDWTLLTRGLFDQQGNVGDRLRTHVGLAWRETDENKWNGLLHYEFRRENLVAGATPAAGFDAHIVAGLINYQATGRLVLSGRLAAKWATDRSDGFVTSSDAQLVMGRATYDLTSRWDAGIIASWLVSDGNAARTYGLGLEVGRIVMTNLRLAAGYNMAGYRDRDLSSFGYTAKGAYLDFAFKFDESLFGRGSTPQAPTGRTR